MAIEIRQHQLKRQSFIESNQNIKPAIDSGYLGSGIGALEECIRNCISERQPSINFLIGRAYGLLKMSLKTYEFWKRASELNV